MVSEESKVSSSTPGRRFVVTNRGRIQDLYWFEGRELGHLGTGGYATVCKGKRKADDAIRAIKAINLQRAGRSTRSFDRLAREISIMKMLDHPGVIKLYEVWEDRKDLYLVMELCTGGELFARICSAGRLTEAEAAVVMRQVMAAVVYLHELGVCHRDLKPENFLFLSDAPIQNNALKLIDFGLSRTFETGMASFWTRVGTPWYVAPQVLQGCYDELVDVWSTGVLMYVLLCGYPPFIGETDAEIAKAVLRGRFDFCPEDWDMISEDAMHLITQMLAFRPAERSSAREALDHVWIHDMAPHAHSTLPLDASRVENLRKFCSMHPFKKATLGVIASLLHEDKIAELRDMFRGMDKNGTGVLCAHDLMGGMKKAGVGEIALDLLEMEQVVKACDETGSGGINYTEFLAAAMDEAHYLQEDICWSAFCVFDRDGDGKIQHAELCEMLHDDGVDMALAHSTAAELIRQIDRAGDGSIDFDEFMHMLRDQH